MVCPGRRASNAVTLTSGREQNDRSAVKRETLTWHGSTKATRSGQARFDSSGAGAPDTGRRLQSRRHGRQHCHSSIFYAAPYYDAFFTTKTTEWRMKRCGRRERVFQREFLRPATHRRSILTTQRDGNTRRMWFIGSYELDARRSRSLQ